MIKVSVIVPVYNVAGYISSCVESLMMQTLQEVEYLFVNDATPDASMEILQSVIDKFPQRRSYVRILTHEYNKGLPAARNTGLSVATGEYIYHCDSDDYMEIDMLEKLYDAAVECKADIVWCDYYVSEDGVGTYKRQPFYSSSWDALKAMLLGVMAYNVWNKLVKRSLYVDNALSFPESYGMGEDMTMIILFACASKVAYVPQAFYYYVQNLSSMTRKHSEKSLSELKYNVLRVEKFLIDKYGNKLVPEISYMKLVSKWFLLIDGHKMRYRKWTECFPEANEYIWGNSNICCRIRFIEWCASKHLWGIVWLHYWIVIRLLYGILYR